MVHLQQTYPDPITPSYVEHPMEEPHLQEPSSASFEDVYALLEDELLSGRLAKGWQQLPAKDDVQRLQMLDTYPEQRRLMELATRIAFTNSPAQLDLAPRKGYVRLYWNGHLRVELRYNIDEIMSRKAPLIAIIMDDMGRSLGDFDKLLNYRSDFANSNHSSYKEGMHHLFLNRQEPEYLLGCKIPESKPLVLLIQVEVGFFV